MIVNMHGKGTMVVLLLVVLSLCLLPESAIPRSAGPMGSLFREALSTFRDAATQWMAFLGAGFYFLLFSLLRCWPVSLRGSQGTFWHPRSPVFWLTGSMVLTALAYAFDYERASKSMQALTFLFGGMLGRGVSLWMVWAEGRARGAADYRERAEPLARTIVTVLMILLWVAVFWQAEGSLTFQYRTQPRWCGPWDNPNTFGVLMGVGVVLSAGRLIERLRAKGQMLKDRWVRQWKEWGGISFYLITTGMVAVGLVKSYSRGAWVGTACGLAYLWYQARTSRIRTNKNQFVSIRGISVSWFLLLAVLASVSVLGFWSLHQTDWLPAQRAVSVANANDFSWRNRVAAWEGALEMIAERPWFGFGWNQPEATYDHFYRPVNVPEGAAIQLNDCFMLGTTLGLPALLCFIAYQGLSLMRSGEGGVAPVRNSECGSPSGKDGVSIHGSLPGIKAAPALDPASWRLDLSRATCRAGAVVLLVGFWFDGGLFKLATGATFWILLELGVDWTTDSKTGGEQSAAKAIPGLTGHSSEFRPGGGK